MPIPYPTAGPSSSTHANDNTGPLASTSTSNTLRRTKSTSSLDSYPSLPSESEDDDSDLDSEEEHAMIQEEWEESLKQMEIVFSVILIPFFGRWYGRQFGYWGEW